MITNYFVILRGPKGHPFAMIDSEDYGEAAKLFPTEEAARKAANNNLFGEHFGFEIVEWEMPDAL